MIDAIIRLLVLFFATGASPALAQSAALNRPMCANLEQRAAIREFYGDRPGAPPPIAERTLGLPEQIIASALAPETAIGVSGEHFQTVWNSVRYWSGSVTHVISHNGNLFKFPSFISNPHPHRRADPFFDVKPIIYGQGMDAHLRPDLYTAIYAINAPGRGNATRAIIFYDASGESVFGLYATLAGEPEAPGRPDEFDRTWTLMGALPRICTDGAH